MIETRSPTGTKSTVRTSKPEHRYGHLVDAAEHHGGRGPQVAAPTTNNVIATDNAGQVRNTGTGNRGSEATPSRRAAVLHPDDGEPAGQASTLGSNAGSRRSAASVSIDKAVRTASLAFSVAPTLTLRFSTEPLPTGSPGVLG